MAEAGHEVIACAPDDGEAGITTALDGIGVGFRDIPMARTGTNPFADLRTLSAYVRLMRRVRPDLGAAYTQKPIITGGNAARIAGVGRFLAMVTGLGDVLPDAGSQPPRWLQPLRAGA